MILNTIAPKVTLCYFVVNGSNIYTFRTLCYLVTGETLPGVSKCKYLGHNITENVSDNDDMSNQIQDHLCSD